MSAIGRFGFDVYGLPVGLLIESVVELAGLQVASAG